VPGHGAIRLAQKRISGGPDRLSQERGYMPLVSRNPSETTATLRQILGVPHGMGSSLVIVRSVQDERAWLLSTRAERVGSQLERLGAIANLASRQSMSNETFGTCISRIAQDFDGLVDALTLSASIAEVLTDACAIPASAAAAQDGLNAKRARIQLLTSCSEHTARSLALTEDAAIAQYARVGAIVAALPNRGEVRLRRSRSFPLAKPLLNAPMPLPNEPRPIPKTNGHLRTLELSRMGDKCLVLIASGAFSEFGEPDYRMAVALWAQALEHEMAELLGHEVRNGLGVKLPDFHWRKQPGLQGIAIECGAHHGPISFNQARPQSPDPDRAPWQPPAMGPLRLGWEAWRARVGAPVPQELTALLLRCKDTRNAASHAGEPIQFRHALKAQADMRKAISMIAGLGIQSWAKTN
jgi:hypothetical protein